MYSPSLNLASAQSSQQLTRLIKEQIRQRRWISFAEFMERALYAPELGYYQRSIMDFAQSGDFTTAPEMTPLFAQSIVHAMYPIAQNKALQVLEIGAGSGQLAYDFLTECAASNITCSEYLILELSSSLRTLQQQKLAEFKQVKWLSSLPESFSGLMIANEVLDAMPVHLIIKKDDAWYELGLSLQEEQWVWQSAKEPCPTDWLEYIPNHEELPIAYIAEIHLTAVAWIRTIAKLLKRGQGGALLCIDYGFPAHEYYHPQRSEDGKPATLMCHYQHHAHTDPLIFIGAQDITSHINFSAMADAAFDEGCQEIYYNSQAAFLINAGITERLQKRFIAGSAAYFNAAQAVQKLLSPAEMGELFKVLIFGSNVSIPDALKPFDRSHRL